MSDDFRFIVVTGLSGAGRTQALRSLEDMGFFCIDNLPLSLVPKLAELCQQAGGIHRIGIAIDIRGGQFFDEALETLEELEQRGFPFEVLFLEAQTETLIRRYQESRRQHPLRPENLASGIEEERRRLEPLRGRAQLIIDTSQINPHQLRQQLMETFGDEDRPGMVVQLVSFGFKHGLPLDADMVFDARFLPNPYYVTSLKDQDGRQTDVSEYVLKWPHSQQLLERVVALFEFLIPQYVREGRPRLNVAIGCTGGRHRSVALIEELRVRLADLFPKLRFQVLHRDADLYSRTGGIDGV